MTEDTTNVPGSIVTVKRNQWAYASLTHAGTDGVGPLKNVKLLGYLKNRREGAVIVVSVVRTSTSFEVLLIITPDEIVWVDPHQVRRP